MMKVAGVVAAGVAIVFVALALTTTQNQNLELLQSKLAAAPITKLVTENGKTVSSQSLWKEVSGSGPFLCVLIVCMVKVLFQFSLCCIRMHSLNCS